jgi:hypothetical protein
VTLGAGRRDSILRIVCPCGRNLADITKPGYNPDFTRDGLLVTPRPNVNQSDFQPWHVANGGVGSERPNGQRRRRDSSKATTSIGTTEPIGGSASAETCGSGDTTRCHKSGSSTRGLAWYVSNWIATCKVRI